jgi:Sec-independent protein secretion pathway component TatC
MAVPLVVLYFGSITAIRISEKRKEKRERANAGN